MIYKHKYFILDSDRRKVFDENGKEIRITGNAFRLLLFLCERRNSNITDIGDYLDHAKDYNEDHIRQYRYKINSILGQDIVEYKNAIYSVVGNVDVVKSLDLQESGKNLLKNDRITDLLHPDSLIFRLNMKNISKNPAVIASIFLLLSFFPWNYGFYTILRWITSLTSIYYILGFYSRQKFFDWKIWMLVFVAVLFNPISPIYLFDKTVWGIIDVLVAGFFVFLIIKQDNKKL